MALLGFDIGIVVVVVVATVGVAAALEPLSCCILVAALELPVVAEPVGPSSGSSLEWNSSIASCSASLRKLAVAFASAGDLIAWKGWELNIIKGIITGAIFY